MRLTENYKFGKTHFSLESVFWVGFEFYLTCNFGFDMKVPSVNSDFQDIGVVRYGYVTYVRVTIVFIFCFIVLRGLAVGKTFNYDILKHPTRLHTLSHNTCIQSLLASGNSSYTVL